MQNCSLETKLLSIGCNACTHAVAWSPAGQIAYAAGRTVALFDPDQDFGVKRTLLGHTGQVTALRWINEWILASGGSDAMLRIWRRVETGGIATDLQAWTCETIATHSKTISCIVSHGNLLVSSAMDGSICVHRFGEMPDSCQLVQQVSYSPLIPLTLALSPLPTSESANDYILAVGGSSTAIALYTSTSRSPDSTEFTYKTKLTGHEDWIRALDFLQDGQDLLLASGSQDRFIRVWRIAQSSVKQTDADAALLDPLANLDLLQNKVFPLAGLSWEARFEALLVSHEDWVFSVQFTRSESGAPLLLSASADSSVILWQPDADADVWTVQAQLGIISTKGASTATGSTGGFWGAVFRGQNRKTSGNTGHALVATRICAWNRTGALRLWQQTETGRWQSTRGVGGHTKQVRSLTWSPEGTFLLSASLDQTTRLWAQEKKTLLWCEFARPQIHGFDLQSLHALSAYNFASGAEEKLVRVFQTPGSVQGLLNRVAGAQLTIEADAAEAANVPALGLSNKALGGRDQGTHLDRSALDAPAHSTQQDETEPSRAPVSKQVIEGLSTAPLEDHLQRHTLFPESEKLYGHGYEIQALTATHDGTLIVSGCRATTPEHACLRVYDASTYRQLGQLFGHALTITQCRFSPDDMFLLSVSRDRSLILYKRTEAHTVGWETAVVVKKAHKRIIWDCAWHPSCKYFATASRDATVSIWRVRRSQEGASVVLALALTLHAAATAVAISAEGLLAVGCEDGSLLLFALEEADESIRASEVLNTRRCDAAMTAVRFNPVRPGELAFCSEDGSVRIEHISGVRA